MTTEETIAAWRTWLRTPAGTRYIAKRVIGAAGGPGAMGLYRWLARRAPFNRRVDD